MIPNTPPFYVGQEIVAIRSHSQEVFKKGDEFVVTSIKMGCCEWLITIGIKSILPFQSCDACGMIFLSEKYIWLGTSSFAPKEQQFEAITYKQVINIESPLISVN